VAALRAHEDWVGEEERRRIEESRTGGTLQRVPSTIHPSVNGSPPRPGEDGRELVISGGKARRVHAARWSKAAERTFFAALADTSNVQAAADACGFSTQAIYERRLRSDAFREQWAAAVETARARLGLGVIELAKEGIEAMLAGVPGEAPKISISEALQILKLGAEPHVPAWPDGRRRLNAGAHANLAGATNEEVAEALAKRLAAFGKRVARDKGKGE
jgi:hypothetical protein